MQSYKYYSLRANQSFAGGACADESRESVDGLPEVGIVVSGLDADGHREHHLDEECADLAGSVGAYLPAPDALVEDASAHGVAGDPLQHPKKQKGVQQMAELQDFKIYLEKELVPARNHKGRAG